MSREQRSIPVTMTVREWIDLADLLERLPIDKRRPLVPKRAKNKIRAKLHATPLPIGEERFRVRVTIFLTPNEDTVCYRAFYG